MDKYYKRSFKCPICKNKWNLASKDRTFQEEGRKIDIDKKDTICPECWKNKIK